MLCNNCDLKLYRNLFQAVTDAWKFASYLLDFPYILFKNSKYLYTKCMKDDRQKIEIISNAILLSRKKQLDFQVKKIFLSLQNILKLICMYFVYIYVAFGFQSAVQASELPPHEQALHTPQITITKLIQEKKILQT